MDFSRTVENLAHTHETPRTPPGSRVFDLSWILDLGFVCFWILDIQLDLPNSLRNNKQKWHLSADMAEARLLGRRRHTKRRKKL